MTDINQYQTPRSTVEANTGEDFADVKVFSPSGRMGRVRFVNYYITIPFAVLMGLFMVLGIITAILIPAVGESNANIASAVMGIIMILIYVAAIIYQFIVIIQRCHDFNSSGWLSLVTLIPVINIIFLFVLLFVPGTQGHNNFGAPTKPNSTVQIVFSILAPFFLIAVIGILAAIAIPAYQGYLEQAQQFEQQQELGR